MKFNITGKKQLIIKAFEEMDIKMLDVLLSEEYSYMNVSKALFLSELDAYFQRLSNFDSAVLDYKAYGGECRGCQKNKKGFAFVNSENESYMSFVFEESDDDYIDIFKCVNFRTYNKKIESECSGIFFYDDDHINYAPAIENIIDEKACIQGVREIKEEQEHEGFLSALFCEKWMEKYDRFDIVKDIFTDKSYRYTRELKLYRSDVFVLNRMMVNNNLAKELFNEFCGFEIINEESIKDWLEKAMRLFNYSRFGFSYLCDFRSEICFNNKLRFNLKELYYSQNLAVILEKYQDWCPEID